MNVMLKITHKMMIKSEFHVVKFFNRITVKIE